jgi:hypothetical protein
MLKHSVVSWTWCCEKIKHLRCQRGCRLYTRHLQNAHSPNIFTLLIATSLFIEEEENYKFMTDSRGKKKKPKCCLSSQSLFKDKIFSEIGDMP